VRAAAREDARVRLVRTSRCGHPSEPRNIGLRLAAGPVIAYLDHDDQWRPEHLRVVLDAFDRGAEAVATGFERRDRVGALLATSTPIGMHWSPEIQLLAPLFEPSRVAHRAGLPEQVGGWRAGLGLEDWDLWVRLTDHGVRFTTVLDPTVEILRDPRAARHALDRVEDPANTTMITAAARADMHAWYDRMRAEGTLVAPLRWEGVLAEHIDQVFAGGPPAAADLVVVPRHGGYAVALPLWCAAQVHAERVEALLGRVYPRQLSLLHGLVGA
jgi:hypothetical protein